MQLLVNEGGASQNTDSGSVVIAYQKDDDLCRRGIRDIKSRSGGKTCLLPSRSFFLLRNYSIPSLALAI